MRFHVLVSVTSAVGLFIAIGLGDVAGAEELAEEGQARAGQVVARYKTIDRYRAVWRLSPRQEAADRGAGQRDPRATGGFGELEVTFQREPLRAFVALRWFSRRDGGWRMQQGSHFLLYDGEKLHRAMAGQRNGEPKVASRPSPAPMTYRRLRQSFMTAYPLDLPLLWSEEPLAEWVQGSVGSVESVNDDGKGGSGLPGLKGDDELGSTSVLVYVEPESRLLRLAEYGPMRYRMAQVQADEPLPDGQFDIDKQTGRLKKGKPALPPKPEGRGNRSR